MIDLGYVLAGVASVTVGIVLGAVCRRGVLTLDARREQRRKAR